MQNRSAGFSEFLMNESRLLNVTTSNIIVQTEHTDKAQCHQAHVAH
jgi:hypothetical protein